MGASRPRHRRGKSGSNTIYPQGSEVCPRRPCPSHGPRLARRLGGADLGSFSQAMMKRYMESPKPCEAVLVLRARTRRLWGSDGAAPLRAARHRLGKALGGVSDMCLYATLPHHGSGTGYAHISWRLVLHPGAARRRDRAWRPIRAKFGPTWPNSGCCGQVGPVFDTILWSTTARRESHRAKLGLERAK